MTKTFRIESRALFLVNTDPQKRCYNGCHYSSELRWTAWQVLNVELPEASVERKLKFWRELNDYAVSQRGQAAKSEFRAVEET